MPLDQSELSDWIDRIVLRDRAAFDALYAATSAKLFGVVLRILKNRAEAEDALQEVYVRIWNKADRFRSGGTSALAWLVTVARNHAIDRLRQRRPVTNDLDAVTEMADTGPTPERAAMAASETSRLNACLERLEKEKAEAVKAAYMEGYTYNELATRYDVPLNTMRTWLRRSLKKLKACLENG